MSNQEAEAKASQVEYLLIRFKQGLVALPEARDFIEFLRADGKPRPAKRTETGVAVAAALTLAELQDRYLEAHEKCLEANTLVW